MKKNGHDDDAALIASGYRANLIMIAMTKKWLERDDLSVADRLSYLEHLNTAAFGALSKAAVNAVEAASDAFEEAFNDAMRVDSSENQAATAFGILERDEAFASLVRLNPSILTAIKLCSRPRAA